MPVMTGVAIVQVWSIVGGAASPPNWVAAAASGSVYTGFASSNAAAQCRIIGALTGSGATDSGAVPSAPRDIGCPTYCSSDARNASPGGLSAIGARPHSCRERAARNDAQLI